MKANEAPEKLYLSKTIYSTYLYQVPDPDDETAVEYTRTDAFVEKACKFLKDKGSAYITIIDGQLILRKGVINDFSKYMKGE